MSQTFHLLEKMMRSTHGILFRYLKPYGLWKGQPKILIHLSKNDGLTKKEIAHHHSLAPSTVTKSIERLEKHQFVKTAVDQHDKRKIRVYITEKGRQTERDLFDYKRFYTEMMFDGISEDELDVMNDILARMVRNINHYKGQNE